MRQALGPLRHREFRLLFAGRLTSLAGSAIAPIALAFAALGGVLVAAVGPGWALGWDGVTYLAGAVFVAAMRVPSTRVAQAGSTVLHELREGCTSSRLGPGCGRSSPQPQSGAWPFQVGWSVLWPRGRLEIFGVFWELSLQQHVPHDRLSRVSSYDALGSFVAIPVGQLLAGPLAAAVGVRTAIWIAVGTFLVAEASVLLVRDVRRLERTDLAVSR